MQVAFAWSLCLSVGVVILSIIPLTIGRVKAGYSVENMSAPRDLFDKLPSFGKRAVWCHQNCWESISLHAPACLLCLMNYLLLVKEQCGVIKIVGKVFPYMLLHVFFV